MDTLMFIVCVVIVLLPLCIWEQRRRAAFVERFPPISDAEYLARCSPGTDPVVALRVRALLSECLCVEYERVYPSSRLIPDLIQDLGA
jgi:hypothetical protein